MCLLSNLLKIVPAFDRLQQKSHRKKRLKTVRDSFIFHFIDFFAIAMNSFLLLVFNLFIACHLLITLGKPFIERISHCSYSDVHA